MNESVQRPGAASSTPADESTEALRASERMLAEAQRVAHIGSWSWDIESNVITWSDEMYRVYGLEPDAISVDMKEFIGRVHPEDRERVQKAVGQALDAGADFEFQHRLVRPDGEVRYCLGRGTSVRGRDGSIVRMVGTGQDITRELESAERERTLQEEQARRAAAEKAARRLAVLAEASETLASSLDYETTLSNVARLAVPRLADWCAVDLVEAGGDLKRLAVAHQDPAKVELVRTLEQRWPAARSAEHGAWKAVRTGQADFVPDIPDELLVAAAVDEAHLAALRQLGLRSLIAAPLRARGRTLGALTMVHAESERSFTEDDRRLVLDLAHRAAMAIDNARLVRDSEEARGHMEEQAAELESQTAEMQELMEELEVTAEQLQARNEELEAITAESERARAAAEEANEAKSQFLAAMSHELRTPLNAIAGYSELLQIGIHGPLNDKQLETLQRIQRNQMRLLGLINDVLNFAKLEAHQVRFDEADIPVDGMLGSLEQIILPQVAAKGISYEYVAAEPGLVVRADREKLEQVVLNLLSNAVKFTQEGGSITLSAAATDDQVLIRVADTGRGIPADRLEHIFEPFIQVDAHLTRVAEGVGLGLSISRDLMRKMGGDITVESTLGAGSVFTAHVPRVPAAG
ncbi:MAG: ATP-binding protein [Gemmatimonadota bacterium]